MLFFIYLFIAKFFSKKQIAYTIYNKFLSKILRSKGKKMNFVCNLL